MKYIDADRLKAEIGKHIKEVMDAAARFTPNMGFFDAKLSGVYDVIAIIDSQQEQLPGIEEHGVPGKDFIPVDWVDACEKYGGRDFAEYVFPELAESEDERIRKTLVEYFGPSAQLDFVRGVPIRKIRDWLEKQKEQKPAEWSEEDEKMLEGIICILQKYVTRTLPTRPNSCTYSGNAFYTHQTEIDWLKSLRPSWKPSEEQMAMLLSVINDPNNAGAESCQIALRELYKKLKGLKEGEK